MAGTDALLPALRALLREGVTPRDLKDAVDLADRQVKHITCGNCYASNKPCPAHR